MENYEVAFGNEVARMISLAFDNEVVLTADGASSLKSTPTNQRFLGTPQTTHVSALPK
jgi:hypothetical protein